MPPSYVPVRGQLDAVRQTAAEIAHELISCRPIAPSDLPGAH